MADERRYILGIETSCDDTAAAVVGRDGRVYSSVIASQDAIHSEHGGVFPDLASRAHIIAIVPAVREALRKADAGHKDLAAIGVTRGPGLIGSLLIGLNAAAGLGMAWKLPVIGVNHLRGHLRSADLEAFRVNYPATVLLVSGGHTLLARATSETDIALLGSTRDDSVGEAYDKVARMLGLGFPGGPAIDRLARDGAASIAFPRPLLDDSLEFSFSGLKSSVARYLDAAGEINRADVAASFVAACLDILTAKCKTALRARPAASLVVVGGVSASPQLRAALADMCAELGVELCLPPLRWSTDNAAMIALAAWDYLRLGKFPKLQPEVRLPITEF